MELSRQEYPALLVRSTSVPETFEGLARLCSLTDYHLFVVYIGLFAAQSSHECAQ